MFSQELKKMVKSSAFFIAIICAVVLLMSGNIYKSNITGEEFSVFDFMMSGKKKTLISESGLYSYDIIVRGVNGYFSMFLPIIVAVPFIAVLCGEKKNNNTRFEIYRIGKNRYAFGKGLASLFVGGCITVIAYLIFSMVVITVFPRGMSEINQLQNVYLSENSNLCRFMMRYMSFFGLVVIKIFRMFLYGAFMAAPTYGLSAVIHNRYIILSVPFMMFYLLDKVVEKHAVAVWYALLPENIGSIYELNITKMILIFGGMVIALFAFYRICLGRKCDCGDS